MSQIKNARPSPALVIAVLALIAAIAGTAIADPFATKGISAKKTKKIAKNVANKQITKRAAGLTVGNANSLAGTPASAYGLKPDWVLVNAAGGVVHQSGGISVTKGSPGVYSVNFPSSLVGRPLSATLNAGGNDNDGSIVAVPCGGTVGNPSAIACSLNNTNNTALVHAYGPGSNNSVDRPFYLIAFKQ